jgi:hypothetical protein
MSAPAPHPHLYLETSKDGRYRLETMGGRIVACGFATRRAAFDAAWNAGYRKGGALADGTEWFGFVPGAAQEARSERERATGNARDALDGALCGVIGVMLFAGLLSLPWPT